MEPDQLIQGLQAGEETAIEALVRAHEKNLYRLALSLLDDPAEAEEATQDTFLAALKAIGSYRGEAALDTWLYRIALNLCRTRLRRRRAGERLKRVLQTLLQMGSQDDAPRPESAAIRNESDTEVWKAVQTLGEKHRLVVLLYYYHEMPVVEITEILKIPAGTVYSRLETAHERLRGILGHPHALPSLQGSVTPREGSKVDPATPEEAVRLSRNLPDGKDYE